MFFAIFHISGALAGARICHVTHSGTQHIFKHQYQLNLLCDILQHPAYFPASIQAQFYLSQTI